MILSALAAVILTTSGLSDRHYGRGAHTDTTTDVKPGTRLQIENFGGEVVVEGWSKDAVHVYAEHSARNLVEVGREGGTIRVVTSGRRGPPLTAELKVQVPRWMDVRVSGVYTDISVQGVEGEVRAETVRGDVSLLGGKSYVSLKSVEGGVTAKGTRGRIEASSVNESVKLEDVRGEISAETVNGDVALAGIVSDAVEVSTVNGNICFGGEIHDGGHYAFSTHGGDITLGIPGEPNASISVSTFNGEFESGFQAKLFEHQGRRYRLTLGKGGADITVESFEGTIHLNPGEEKCE